MHARESTQESDAEAEDHLQHAAKSAAERVQLGPQHEGLIREKTTPVATGDSVSSLRANASLLATSPQTLPQNDTQANVSHLPQQARAGDRESAAQRHEGCSTCLLQPIRPTFILPWEPTSINIMDCSGPTLEESYSCFSDSLLPLIGTGFTSKETDWAARLQLENTSFSLAEWSKETAFGNDSLWTSF
jgi:hypothetical protein